MAATLFLCPKPKDALTYRFKSKKTLV